MSSTKPVSGLRLYLSSLFFVFLVLAALRVAFWLFAAPDMPEPLGKDALKAFYIGLRFDGRIAGLLTLPLGAALCVPWSAKRLHKARTPLACLYGLLFFLLFLIYTADFGFYAYLGNRVSTLAFELLQDVDEAVGMVVKSYPVAPVAVGLPAAAALCAAVFYRILRAPVCLRPSKKGRALGFFCGFFIFAFFVYGQLNSSLFPLRWSYAYFTTSEPIIALGLNPVQNLYDTYGLSRGTYSLEATRAAYPFMAGYLRVDQPDERALNYRRRFVGRAEQARPLNVVILLLESFSFPKTSFAPGALDPTPELRELAEESLYFSRFFANARTTARGIYSTVTGIPDSNQGTTASRNALTVDQRVIGNEFAGYKRFYLIGGNTSWANIRAVLAQNIDRLNILEEDYWQAPRADVWGVSDADLLKESHRLLAGQDPDTPFLAVIQTAGFHKPYTVPDDFTVEAVSEKDRKNYGFEHQEEYASMRFMDRSVGEFIRSAKAAPYYKNTVFLIFGDHGLKASHTNMPAGYEASNLAPWHTPFIIHASPELGLFAPGKSDMLCSQVDVFPTAAGLAGIPYANHTLGRDLFDTRYNNARAVFIGGNEPVRLLFGDFCYYDNPFGNSALYRPADRDGRNLAEEEPEVFRRLQTMARDMDATARYMLFNNKKAAKAAAP